MLGLLEAWAPNWQTNPVLAAENLGERQRARLLQVFAAISPETLAEMEGYRSWRLHDLWSFVVSLSWPTTGTWSTNAPLGQKLGG